MKKIIAVLLCVSCVFGICACTSTKEYESLPSATEDGHVAIIRAELTNEIRGTDAECITSSSTAPEGGIFADVVVYVENMLPTDFDKSAITGKVLYNGDEYDLQYSLENDNCTGVSTDAIAAESAGVVHMFGSIPNDALDSKDPIYAKVTVSGNTVGTVVSAMDYREPINKKQELRSNTPITILDGDVIINPISCKVTDNIKTTGAQSATNKVDGIKIDAVIEVTNNMSKYNIQNIFGYVVKDGNDTKALTKVETDKNLVLSEFGENTAIKPGETKVIHIYADYENSSDSIVRINILGNCFYMKAGS